MRLPGRYILGGASACTLLVWSSCDSGNYAMSHVCCHKHVFHKQILTNAIDDKCNFQKHECFNGCVKKLLCVLTGIIETVSCSMEVLQKCSVLRMESCNKEYFGGRETKMLGVGNRCIKKTSLDM